MNIDYHRLLVKIARLYYEQDLTQAQIGDRLRLSRQKVQRLLRETQNQGVVQIYIKPIMKIFGDLEKALEDRFELTEAVVVETTAYNHQQTAAREVGAGAAEYLSRVVRSHDRIVMSWGGSLLGMVNALAYNPPVDAEDVVVIQGLGGIANPNNEVHATELVRRLAKALGAQAMLLPAPGIAASRGARDAFSRDPHVVKVLETARTASLAFMGIGSPRPDSILVHDGTIVTWPKLVELMERGAVGDINLRYFDEHGGPVSSDLDDCVIGLTLEDIKRIDRVVGVAGGAVKFKAIKGALNGKLVDVLVTDHVTAEKLSEAKREP